MAKEAKHSFRTTGKKRRTAFREAKERFLILCEGENTEISYFKSFKLVTASVRSIHINEGDAYAIVRNAIRRKIEFPNYDQYWIVFDKDDTSSGNFNKAIELGRKNGFKIAYSNQAFEYWYLLHFKKYTGKINRTGYAYRLDHHLSFKYDKSKVISKKMYDILFPSQEKAIKNAKAIYNAIGDHSNPAQEESSTTVFQLVSELNKYI